ncbi:recoverin isoform 2-T2 [Erethizon dorsatum]
MLDPEEARQMEPFWEPPAPQPTSETLLPVMLLPCPAIVRGLRGNFSRLLTFLDSRLPSQASLRPPDLLLRSPGRRKSLSRESHLLSLIPMRCLTLILPSTQGPLAAIFKMINPEDVKHLPDDENTPEKRTEKVWTFFGKKDDDKLSEEEFIEGTLANKEILRLIQFEPQKVKERIKEKKQ